MNNGPVVLGLILRALFSVAYDAERPTERGPVGGRSVEVLGRSVEEYRGIPYAKPPVGELRFKPPVQAERWDEVLDATNGRTACAQVRAHGEVLSGDIVYTEDCLYLNVWTTRKASERAPVLVWIYGGGFTYGSASYDNYTGAVLAAKTDCVVVSMNYRVGILGFLNADSPEAPGNVGLLDQHMALVWIKKNIHNFGGDPSRVTLFGESAGGMSVHAHVLSPMSRGLLRRAVMLSGNMKALDLVDAVHESVSMGDAVAAIVGCSDGKQKTLVSHPEDVVNCLRTKSADELVTAASEAAAGKLFPFLPTYHDEFLPKVPAVAVEKGFFQDVDVLMGVTSDEGLSTLVWPRMRPELLAERLDHVDDDALRRSLQEEGIKGPRHKSKHRATKEPKPRDGSTADFSASMSSFPPDPAPAPASVPPKDPGAQTPHVQPTWLPRQFSLGQRNSPQPLGSTRFLLCGTYCLCVAVLVICVAAAWKALAALGSDPVLSTSAGVVYGTRIKTASGGSLNQFLGIPYALDTAGERRFADPVPVTRFPDGVWIGHDAGSPCSQWINGSALGSEDCLRLSVWASARVKTGHRSTVVVALTGRWFQNGDTTSDGAMDWAQLAAHSEAVVVRLNHRLGVFGFLDAGVRGLMDNVAVQDVLLALSWIKQNAIALQVDPGSMVALGLGSGAYLLCLLMMSSAKAVFTRALLQGPCTTTPLPRNSPQTGRVYLERMSRHLNCSSRRIAGQAKCLREASAEDVLRISRELEGPLRFVPSPFNGDVLSTLHETAHFDGVKLLLGSDVTEGKRLYDDVIFAFLTASGNASVPGLANIFPAVMSLMKGDTSEFEAAAFERAFKNTTRSEFEECLVHMWTTCSSKMLADEVTEKGGSLFHYVINSTLPYDMPLTLQEISKFLIRGQVSAFVVFSCSAQ